MTVTEKLPLQTVIVILGIGVPRLKIERRQDPGKVLVIPENILIYQMLNAVVMIPVKIMNTEFVPLMLLVALPVLIKLVAMPQVIVRPVI